MIKVLSKKVSDRIAAGEVIERPVSIVKELVENSIDSGASEINVEIKNGGKTYIRVTDNGCGIAAEDTETAFLRHATSKIEEAEDLDHIRTLGFRGEALASICAVTRTELVTKTKDEKTATKLLVHGSTIISNEKIGAPAGTTLIIRDLFYNTPARQKFLKNDGAEAGRITSLMSEIAVTRPDIRFTYENNGRMLFSTRGTGDLKATILEVYKERDLKNLIPLNYEYKGVKVGGFISKPDFSKNSKRDQYFFVNGRTIRSKVIERGVQEGYAERLFEGRHPVCFIFIETNPEYLDVNIHPNKMQVRFDDDNVIRETVRLAIIKTLSSDIGMRDAVMPKEIREKAKSADFEKDEKGVSYYKVSMPAKDSETQIAGAASAAEAGATPAAGTSATSDYNRQKPAKKRESIFPAQKSGGQVNIKEILKAKRAAEESVKKELELAKEKTEKSSSGPVFSAIKEPGLKPFDISELRLSGVVFGTYLICQDDNAFYLIDQHAAHERVFYEQFVGAYLDSNKNTQLLMVPFTFTVPVYMADDDSEWTDFAAESGYQIEIFGENTYMVRGIPEFMTLEEAEIFINQLVTGFAEGEKTDNRIVIDKLITKSCKAAIKAHDYISVPEAQALLNSLMDCRNPFSCPHGRPTFLRYTEYEIEHMFQRA